MVDNKRHVVAAPECIDTQVFFFEDTYNVLEGVICWCSSLKVWTKHATMCMDIWGDSGWLIISDTFMITFHLNTRDSKNWSDSVFGLCPSLLGSIVDRGICTAM